ncbi:MAG: glycosyltransferase family 4 protein [Candidatus Aenigmarchaeota archaeon]|nr:glycosyltransferase family 4 protein [Candidatus Aenigmarchaeota archaeon]
MKILYVHELFPPEIIGGGEIYAENLLLALKKRGIDVFVITGTKKKTRLGKYKGIPVYRVNLFPSRYFFNLKSVPMIEKIVKKFKPDIIHGNAMQSAIPCYIVGKKYNIPIIINVHFFFQEYYRNYFDPVRSYMYSKIERFIMSFPYDKIISLDHYIYDNLKKIGIKSILIEHPINTKLFKPKKKPEKFTIGTAMTIGPSKRNDIFIKLAKKHKEFEYIAVGFYNKKFKNKLEKIGIKAPGYLPREKMPEFYNKISVYFGHGMAAKEAMACGTPVILNENTERLRKYHYKELKAGLILTGSFDKLIKKLQNKKYYNNLSKKCSLFIKNNYSEKIIIPKIIKEYKKLIK